MMNPNSFMNGVNILSLILQLQNAEAFKIDEMQEHVEAKIDRDINTKLDDIIKRLDRIEKFFLK